MKWEKITLALGLLGLLFLNGCSTTSSPEIAQEQIILSTPTLTATITPTVILELSPSPNITPTREPTPTFVTFEEINHSDDDTLIFVTDFFAYQNFIVSLQNNIMKEFIVEDDYVSLIGWSQNGCELIGRHQGNSLLIDLEGNVIEVISRWSDRPFENLSLDSISPTGEWVTYIHGYGYHDYARYELQDLVTVSTNNPADYYQLTSNGGAVETAWDPTGNFLAYTDYDAGGVQQLYISQPNGIGKVKLTGVVDNTIMLSEPLWSPFGSLIALKINYSDNADEDGEFVQIISWESGNTSLVNTLGLYRVGSYWWHDANTLAVYGYFYSTEKNDYEWEIRWIDFETEEIRYRLNTAMTNTQEIAWPRPIGSSNQIGFFVRTRSGNWFHIYDIYNKEIIYRHNIGYLDLGDWIPAPLNFPGKEACLIR